MSVHSKGLLFLLQRCVAVRRATLSTRIKSSGGVLSGWCGPVQQRARTSAAWTPCLQRLCPLPSAAKSSQYSFCTKSGEPCGDEYPPVPSYQPDPESETKELYIVQVAGLPWSCKAEDLLQFFSDCRIRDGLNGIHLTVNRQGKPSGQAFIELEHQEDISKAKEKHGHYLGPRYVEVYEVTNKYAEAILKTSTLNKSSDGVVWLRGLPFGSTEDDIIDFFSGLVIVENGVTIVTDQAGRNTGQAFVQFSSQEVADEALQRNMELIGNRYIEVFPSRSDEIYSQKTRSFLRPHDSRPPAKRTPEFQSPRIRPSQGSAQPLHYIHMRGLPFKVTGEDVVRFFSPLAVSKIMIEFGPDGRPSGVADIHFRFHQDALDAMSRNGQYIGGRYIELFLNSVPTSDRW